MSVILLLGSLVLRKTVVTIKCSPTIAYSRFLEGLDTMLSESILSSVLQAFAWMRRRFNMNLKLSSFSSKECHQLMMYLLPLENAVHLSWWYLYAS